MKVQEIITNLQFGHIIRVPLLYIEHEIQVMTTSQQQTYIFIPTIYVFVVIALIIYLVRKILILRRNFLQESVLLEITPPAFTEKSAYTTEQLFSVIHNAKNGNKFINLLLDKKTVFSFEIVSTREKGIRYVIRTDLKQKENLKRKITSYLPGVLVHEVKDYLKNPIETYNSSRQIIELKLSSHFAYPLEKQNMLDQHDPVAYITGMMTQLKKDELIAIQIVLAPIKTIEAKKISNMILRQEDVLSYLDSIRPSGFVKVLLDAIKLIGLIINKVGQELQWALTEMMHGSSSMSSVNMYSTTAYQQQLKVTKIKPMRQLSSFETEIVTSIQAKITQPLFATSIRVLVSVSSQDELQERVNGLISSFEPFSVPQYQSLKTKWNFPPVLIKQIRDLVFQKRLLSLINNKSSSLLSVSEVADLYHFPFSNVTQTENIAKSYSYELPAPVSLKQGTKFDVIFGRNMYAGVETLIGLTPDQRARHMVIFGGTGNGKTTLISEMMQQDMQNGKGLCFIDPHGDAAERALQMIPTDREKDVVWVDPYDIDRPLAINLMELTPNLKQNDALREKERVAEGIVSLFRRVCASDFSKAGSNAFRIENTLLNAIYTAFYVPDCTLFTIYDLLNDPVFLRKTVGSIEDKRLKDFWKNEFGRAGDYQIVKMVGGVTARIGKFLHSESARRIFEQPKSTLLFDHLMDSKKIILCNLSKGKLSEDISQVIGTAILTKMQLSIMARATIHESERIPFYLYIDEFQNFASDYFVGMLAEARKYKLHIVIVEQSTSQQQDQSLINIILANVAIIICFRTANPADEDLILPQFAPMVKKGDIMNLPWFHFFIKIYAAVAQEPFTGETVPLRAGDDKEKGKRIIQLSSQKYGNIYKRLHPKSDAQQTPNIIDTKDKNNKTITDTTIIKGSPDEN